MELQNAREATNLFENKNSLLLTISEKLLSNKTFKKVRIRPPYNSIKQIDNMGWKVRVPEVRVESDDIKHPTKSQIFLFEENKILGPSHSLHEDIGHLGGGRFSHWEDALYFSTSDGTNPNNNRRNYFVGYFK